MSLCFIRLFCQMISEMSERCILLDLTQRYGDADLCTWSMRRIKTTCMLRRCFTQNVAADSAQDEEDYVVYEHNMQEPGEKRVRYRMTHTVFPAGPSYGSYQASPDSQNAVISEIHGCKVFNVCSIGQSNCRQVFKSIRAFATASGCTEEMQLSVQCFAWLGPTHISLSPSFVYHYRI